MAKDLNRGPDKFRPFSSTRGKSILTPGLLLALGLVVLLAIASISIGAYDIRGNEGGWKMVFITRIPRTLSLVLTGASMATSGLVMQLLTQNKMVEPTTTGTIEWAGLGLLFAYLIFPSPSLVQRMTGAIVFSFVGTMVFFLFLRRIRLKSSLIVPIIGMMLGAVVSAVSTFMGLVTNMTQPLEVWFAGSFASVQVGRFEYLWLVVVASIVIYLYADRLTLAGLGEDMATNLGANYQKIVLVGTGIIALTVGVVAAVIGNLPFIGLIVPNVVSLFRGDDLRSNLPRVSVLGMGVVMVCDIISRMIIMPFEVPVSTILGTFGAAVFIGLLVWQRRRKYAG